MGGNLFVVDEAPSGGWLGPVVAPLGVLIEVVLLESELVLSGESNAVGVIELVEVVLELVKEGSVLEPVDLTVLEVVEELECVAIAPGTKLDSVEWTVMTI